MSSVEPSDPNTSAKRALHSGFALLLVLAVFLAVADRTTPLRYLVYLSPIITASALAVVGSLGQSFRRGYSTLFIITGIYVAIISTTGPSPIQAFLILSGLSLGVFQFTFPGRMLDVLFYSLFAYQIYLTIDDGFSFDDFDILSSSRLGETHTIPFVIVLFVGHYFYRRRRLHALLAFLLLILSGKRIALAASVVAMLATAIPYRALHSSPRVRFLSALIAILVVGVFAANVHLVLRPIAEIFRIDANVLTSGRFGGQTAAITLLGQATWDQLLFGSGLGTADRAASTTWMIEGIQIHNDYLRMLIDIGWVGFFCISLLYSTIAYKSVVGFNLVITSSVIWISDNVLTYTFYVVCLILVKSSDESTIAVSGRQIYSVRVA